MHAAFARWLERTGPGRPTSSRRSWRTTTRRRSRPEDVDLAWAGDEARSSTSCVRVRSRGSAAPPSSRSAGWRSTTGWRSCIAPSSWRRMPSAEQSLWREIGRANILKYDGEAFWDAMQEALDARGRPRISRRSVRGARVPGVAARRDVEASAGRRSRRGWIDRALELAAPGTAARARALIAQSDRQTRGVGRSREEACEIADGSATSSFGRSAWMPARDEALARGDYEEAVAWADAASTGAAVDRPRPHLADLRVRGRWPSSRRQARRGAGGRRAYDVVTQQACRRTIGCTPPGRHVALDGVPGRWERVPRSHPACGGGGRAPTTIDPACSAPRCSSRVRLAHVHLGDEPEARRLEQAGCRPRLRWATVGCWILSRSRSPSHGRAMDEVARRLRDWSPDGLDDVEGLAVRLDAFVLAGSTRRRSKPRHQALVEPGAVPSSRSPFEPWGSRGEDDASRAGDRSASSRWAWTGTRRRRASSRPGRHGWPMTPRRSAAQMLRGRRSESGPGSVTL